MSDEQLWQANDMVDLLLEDEVGTTAPQGANIIKKRRATQMSGFVPRKKRATGKKDDDILNPPSISSFTPSHNVPTSANNNTIYTNNIPANMLTTVPPPIAINNTVLLSPKIKISQPHPDQNSTHKNNDIH